MPQIYIASDLGNSVPNPQRGGASAGGQPLVAEAVGNLANTAGRIASQQIAQERQEAEQLEQARAANSAMDYELQTKRIASDIQNLVQTGALDYREAQKRFDDEAGKLKPAQLQTSNAALIERYNGGLAQTRNAVGAEIGAFVQGRQRLEFKNQFIDGLDKLGKLASEPGANIDLVHRRADASAEWARRAGIDDAAISKTLQDFKDNNFANLAQQHIIDAGEDVDSLRSVAASLSAKDGYFIDKLDPNKRLALLKSVESQIDRIDYRNQLRRDRIDVKAERALLEMDRQNASGIPSTPEMRAKWADTIKGSSFEQDYKDRLADEDEIQRVLRMPVADQISYAQQQKADLMQSGGDLRKAANVERLSGAIKRNAEKRLEAPLVYLQERAGLDVQPVSPLALLDPDQQSDAQGQFSDRISAIASLGKDGGGSVQMRPLLPAEVEAFKGAINSATPDEAGQLFGALRTAIDDRDAYMGAMQQIAPDSPVRAAAGMLLAGGGTQVMETNWLSPDASISAQAAASTILTGEAILNKSKLAAASDGKGSALAVPSMRDFADEMQAQLGGVFAGRPETLQAATQVVRAHYVGEMAETGDYSKDLDPSRLQRSIKAALGVAADYNGSKLLLPWGMDESSFSDAAPVAFLGELKRRGLNTQQANSEITKFRNAELANYGDGAYLVLDSARRPYLVNDEPVVIRVAP